MPEKKILIVHPNDKTTTFLDRIKNHIIKCFGDEVHHFNIYTNDNSHERCLERIANHSENGIIIFLGHGRSDKLHGGKGNMYETKDFVSEEAINEAPDKFYYNDNFINTNNVQVFKGKKVFCLACNSNDEIGRKAVEMGAISFFGFGDIPTSMYEFRNKGVLVHEETVIKMKTELNCIIKLALSYAIRKNLNFGNLQDIIQFIVSQRIAQLLINQKKFKQRYLLTDNLYRLKHDLVVHGDRYAKIISW